MFHFIDKPKGISSFKALWDIKKAHPWEKVGHAGTLDPMATGLMIVAVGRQYTKHISHFVGMDKRYETTLDFSLYTDTWDDEHRQERVILDYDDHQIQTLEHPEMFVKYPDRDDLARFVWGLEGSHVFPLPDFSAKKVWGKKLYDLARKGITSDRSKEMTIYHIEVLEYSFPLVSLRMHVSSGTYIRSMGRVIGQQFGLGWALIALRRTQIWPYQVGQGELWLEEVEGGGNVYFTS